MSRVVSRPGFAGVAGPVEERCELTDGPGVVLEPPSEPPEKGIILPPGASPSPRFSGPPLDRRNPFLIGLTGAFGVAVAYLVVRAVVDTAGVLLLVGIALFLA